VLVRRGNSGHRIISHHPRQHRVEYAQPVARPITGRGPATSAARDKNNRVKQFKVVTTILDQIDTCNCLWARPKMLRQNLGRE
jgi:hypothetical protein